MPCETFPVTEDGTNPAIRLFGRRLFNDQSTTEFLVELLLVMNSTKRLGSDGSSFSSPLPDRVTLDNWPRMNGLQLQPQKPD